MNHQIFERKWRFRDMPGSTPLWVSILSFSRTSCRVTSTLAFPSDTGICLVSSPRLVSLNTVKGSVREHPSVTRSWESINVIKPPLVCGPHAPELTVLFQCFVFPCRWQLVDKDSPCGMIKNDCWSVEDAIERWAGWQDAWVNMSAHALVPPTLSQSVWPKLGPWSLSAQSNNKL